MEKLGNIDSIFIIHEVINYSELLDLSKSPLICADITTGLLDLGQPLTL